MEMTIALWLMNSFIDMFPEFLEGLLSCFFAVSKGNLRVLTLEVVDAVAQIVTVMTR